MPRDDEAAGRRPCLIQVDTNKVRGNVPMMFEGLGSPSLLPSCRSSW
jgi:hypothetical protein